LTVNKKGDEMPKDAREKKASKDFWVDKNGKRIDGRTVTDVRPIKIEAGVLPNVDGSCYLEWGQNKVLVSVSGPRECLPKHEANPYRAIIRYTYRMASFSVPDRKNPRPGRREIEISKVSGEALERSVFLERFPNTSIDVFVEVLDSNAGTRIACLTAASVALADAGIPMRDLVSGITVGRAEGKLIVDLNKHEEDAPDAVDVAMAFLPNSKEVVLLQMDGEITPEEFKELNKIASEEVGKIYEIQKEALKKAFADRKPEPVPEFAGEVAVENEESEENKDWKEPKDPLSFGSSDYAEEEETVLGGESIEDAEHEAYDAGRE
jgi:exosome complex component RRP41